MRRALRMDSKICRRQRNLFLPAVPAALCETLVQKEDVYLLSSANSSNPQCEIESAILNRFAGVLG